MKKLFLIFTVGIGLAACGDNMENKPGTGGSIDSSLTSPPDNTRVKDDTTDAGIGDSAMRKDSRDGTSSGESGSSTGSKNSGSAKDDTKGNK